MQMLPTLKLGSKGPYVKKLKMNLNGLGYKKASAGFYP